MTTTEAIDPSEPVAADVVDAGAIARTRRRPFRTLLSVLVGIVAVVGLLTSVVAVWAKNSLFDAKSVASAVDSALQQPEVTAAMAVYLTDQIMEAVDAEDFVAGVLPPALGPLSPALVGGVRSFVSDRLEKLLATDEVRAVLTTVVERAHKTLMRLLRGEIDLQGVTVADGEVTVNLLPLLGLGLARVQDLGILENVTIPTLSGDGDPSQQRGLLEKALGHRLPANFGQLVVYRSESLKNAEESLQRAQDALVLARRALVVLLIVTAVAFAGSLLLSVRRGRTALILLLASAATMVVARAIIRRVVDHAPTLVVQPGARAAVLSTVTTLSSGLLTMVTLLAIIGVVGAIVIYLIGDSPRAVSMRGRVGSTGSGLRGLFAGHGDAVAIVAFGAAVFVIFVTGLGLGSLLIAAVFAAVGAFALTQRTDGATLPPA